MSEAEHLDARAVWFDVPVADLDRAVSFDCAVSFDRAVQACEGNRLALHSETDA